MWDFLLSLLCSHGINLDNNYLHLPPVLEVLFYRYLRCQNSSSFEKFPVVGHLNSLSFTDLQTEWNYMSTGLKDLCMGIDVTHSQLVHIYLVFLEHIMSLHIQHYRELMSTEILLLANTYGCIRHGSNMLLENYHSTLTTAAHTQDS